MLGYQKLPISYRQRSSLSIALFKDRFSNKTRTSDERVHGFNHHANSMLISFHCTAATFVLENAHGKFGRRPEPRTHVYCVRGQSPHPPTRAALDPDRPIQRGTKSRQRRDQEGQHESKFWRGKLCRKTLHHRA